MSANLDLYTAGTVRELDEAAIASGIPGFSLMRRAGDALLCTLNRYYPDATRIHIYCGAGNNAGDGYVLARLAKQQGMEVDVTSLVDADILKGDAATARDQWLELGEISSWQKQREESADVIIDALLGIGLDRSLDGDWKRCVESINASDTDVLAVDIPTGLQADTGCIMGAAVRAAHTVSFIGHKQGLFTADAIEYRGTLHFDDLGVPASIYQGAAVSARRLLPDQLRLPRRPSNSHKFDFGRVLIVGGNQGMAGAVALAAKAALVAGAGLVRVVTLPEHVSIVTSICPEAMVHGSADGSLPDLEASAVSHVLIGCGLGQDAWGQRCLNQVSAMKIPVVYDADALNLIAIDDKQVQNTVAITPHPGEAARLLGSDSSEIQSDRYANVRRLTEAFHCCAVLKGSGSLVADEQCVDVCDSGSAAMATAGMGDVLAGIIVAFIAQGLSPFEACRHAVSCHASAAMQVAAGKSRGVLASAVIDHLAEVLYEAR